jgi:hypothetical protein
VGNATKREDDLADCLTRAACPARDDLMSLLVITDVFNIVANILMFILIIIIHALLN